MSVDGSIKYDYVKINSSLEDINARFQVLLTQEQDIQSEKSKLEAAWIDDVSAPAYQAVQTKWNESFREITAILNTVRQAATTAVADMQQTNAKLANQWGG